VPQPRHHPRRRRPVVDRPPGHIRRTIPVRRPDAQPRYRHVVRQAPCTTPLLGRRSLADPEKPMPPAHQRDRAQAP
jgi:hypothetical protein